MKVVVNRCHGGFTLSDVARAQLARARGVALDCLERDWELKRDALDLIAVVEAMGRASEGPYTSLEVVEIPDDVEWQIDEYDGAEWVAEKHRTW
jgi:hypothetical protein